MKTVAEMRAARAAGSTDTTEVDNRFWWEHKRDAALKAASDKLDAHEARAKEAAKLRKELAAKRKAEGYRF